MSSYEELSKLKGYNIWEADGFGYSNKKNSTFKENWDEEILIKELEDSLEINNNEQLYHQLNRVTEINDMNKKFKHKFIYTIPKCHQSNFLTDFYIIFEYDKLELELFEKMKILDTKLTISISGQILDSIDLDTNLLLCLLSDKKYIDYGDSISIPLFFFNQFNNEMFPSWNTIQQELTISLDSNNNNFNDLFNIKIKYDWFQGYMNHIKNNNNEIMFIPYIQNTPVISNKISSILLKGLNLTYKLLIIRFIPKENYEEIELNDNEQPIIESVSISVNYNDPFYLKNIFCFKFMGITLYCVGLSPEFDNYETMKFSLKNILNNNKCSDKGLIIPNNSKLYIKSNDIYNNFYVKTNFITSNSLGFYMGLVGVRLIIQTT